MPVRLLSCLQVLQMLLLIIVLSFKQSPLVYSSGVLTPDELEAEYGDDLDFLIMKLKLAHKDTEVSKYVP